MVGQIEDKTGSTAEGRRRGQKEDASERNRERKKFEINQSGRTQYTTKTSESEAGL